MTIIDSAPPAALDLDDRQRAMLREMGVRVWSPPPPPPLSLRAGGGVDVEVKTAATPAAAVRSRPPGNRADEIPAAALREAPRSDPDRRTSQPPSPAQTRPSGRKIPAPMAHGVEQSHDKALPVLRMGAWQSLIGPAHAPFSDATDAGDHPLWLVLVESEATDLLAGDAGRLLSNMLRAAGLTSKSGARVVGAAVGRAPTPLDDQPSASTNGAAHLPPDQAVCVQGVLHDAIRAQSPVMIVAMGRPAVLLALQSTDPLGKLRGQALFCQGVPVVPTYAPDYLLRAPLDKPRVWADWCRALSLVAAPTSAQANQALLNK